ncbi:MAG: ATP/GTP-binding protein, partial [uncultured Nocardioidaceae bacterium]
DPAAARVSRPCGRRDPAGGGQRRLPGELDLAAAGPWLRGGQRRRARAGAAGPRRPEAVAGRGTGRPRRPHGRPDRHLGRAAPRGGHAWRAGGLRRAGRPGGLRTGGRRRSDPRRAGLSLAAELVPPPQTSHRAAARALLRRAGPALPADLQAGLGPARRCRRGRRVPTAGGGTGGRGGDRARPSRRSPAAHRLAAPVERLGRRRVPGLRRRGARPLPARRCRQAAPRDPSGRVLFVGRGPRAGCRLHRPPDRGRAAERRRRRRSFVHRVRAPPRTAL